MVKQRDYLSRRKARRIRRFVVTVLIATGLLLLVYLAVFSGIFAIQSVELRGFPEEYQLAINNAAHQFLQQKRLGVLRAENILLFDRTGLRRQLLSELPELAELRFSYRLKEKQFVLTGALREPTALICRLPAQAGSLAQTQATTTPAITGDVSCFLVDEQGVLFTLKGDWPIIGLKIEDRQNLEFREGVHYVPPEAFVFLDEFSRQSEGSLAIEKIVFDKDAFLASYLNLETTAGWEILLGYKLDSEILLQHLNQLLEKEVGEKIEQLEYVDLRFEDRAYYKLRS